MLYATEPDLRLDSYKNLQVLWVRALLASSGQLEDAAAMHSDLGAMRLAIVFAVIGWMLLRDAIMRPGMDDSAVSGLVQFIYFSYSDILSRLYTNSDYLRKVVLDGLSFTIEKGQKLGICGSAGCGKSTALRECECIAD